MKYEAQKAKERGECGSERKKGGGKRVGMECGRKGERKGGSKTGNEAIREVDWERQEGQQYLEQNNC